jgi:hypothetical protein
MPTYMLQWFQPRLEEDAFIVLSEALTHAASGLRSEGTPIRHLVSALSCPDEMAFCLLEAPSSDAAREVGTRAGLRIERITEALFTGGGVWRRRSSSIAIHAQPSLPYASRPRRVTVTDSHRRPRL